MGLVVTARQDRAFSHFLCPLLSLALAVHIVDHGSSFPFNLPPSLRKVPLNSLRPSSLPNSLPPSLPLVPLQERTMPVFPQFLAPQVHHLIHFVKLESGAAQAQGTEKWGTSKLQTSDDFLHA